jgi:hypothetical protein
MANDFNQTAIFSVLFIVKLVTKKKTFNEILRQLFHHHQKQKVAIDNFH